MTRGEIHVAYNLKVGRDPDQVRKELMALLRAYDPSTLSLCECVGYSLPALPGKKLIRDRSRPGRANLALYVSAHVGARPRWRDLTKTWPRTEHAGTHWARSVLRVRLRGLLVEQLLPAHAPPKSAGTGPARQEWLTAMVEAMAPWTRDDWAGRAAKWLRIGRGLRRLAVIDFNGMAGVVATRVNGRWRGPNETNAAVSRNLEIQVREVEEVDGVRLLSDHPALVVTVRKAR